MRVAPGVTVAVGRGGNPRQGSPVILAAIEPALGPLTAGAQIGTALSDGIDQTSNYTSTGGEISSVTVTITVDGAPALADDIVDRDAVVTASVLVRDDQGTERLFDAGTQVVAPGESAPAQVVFDGAPVSFDGAFLSFNGDFEIAAQAA